MSDQPTDYQVWRAPAGKTHAVSQHWSGDLDRLCRRHWGPDVGWEWVDRLTPVTCKSCQRSCMSGAFDAETKRLRTGEGGRG